MEKDIENIVKLHKPTLRQDVQQYMESFQQLLGKQLIKFAIAHPLKIPSYMKTQKDIEEFGQQFVDERINDYNLLRAKKEELDLLNYVTFYRKGEVNITKYLEKKFGLPNSVKHEEIELDGIIGLWHRPEGTTSNKCILFIHGGGWYSGSFQVSKRFHSQIAEKLGINILSINYRLSPEYPFPAGLEDCIIAYQALLEHGILPQDIVIAGESAGANLAISMVLKMRMETIPVPSGIIAIAPMTDFTFSDPRFFDNAKTDIVLGNGANFWAFAAYVGMEDPKNPLISPLFGEFQDFPPILIQVSEAEILYSDSLRLAEKIRVSGGDCTFQTWKDMVHVFQYVGSFNSNWPEIEEAFLGMQQFISRI